MLSPMGTLQRKLCLIYLVAFCDIKVCMLGQLDGKKMGWILRLRGSGEWVVLYLEVSRSGVLQESILRHGPLNGTCSQSL